MLMLYEYDPKLRLWLATFALCANRFSGTEQPKMRNFLVDFSWCLNVIKINFIMKNTDIWRGTHGFLMCEHRSEVVVVVSWVWYMEVSGQYHAVAAFYQVKKSLDPFCWRLDGFQNRSGFLTSIHCWNHDCVELYLHCPHIIVWNIFKHTDISTFHPWFTTTQKVVCL
jgi:hypothetical protein